MKKNQNGCDQKKHVDKSNSLDDCTLMLDRIQVNINRTKLQICGRLLSVESKCRFAGVNILLGSSKQPSAFL